MNGPPQPVLDCPNPARCPVAIDRFTDLCRTPALLPTCTIGPERFFYRVYSHVDGSHQANPGYGSTRFAPFPSIIDRRLVPTIYMAQTLAAALLESVFHNVSPASLGIPDRVVPLRDVRGKAFVNLAPPRQIHLIDMRDGALEQLGIDRSHIVSSPAEHYPCTRRVAQLLHAVPAAGDRPPFDGIIWLSRQAELHSLPPAEVLVVFTDRVPAGRSAAWRQPNASGSFGALDDGAGYVALQEAADQLGVTLEDT